MKVHLALYDPAHALANGNYWAWHSPRLQQRLLDAFYYEAAAKHLPKDPNALMPDETHGGCAGVDDQWCCWYRFFNGGRDQRGRPGRFVILTAFIKREDHAGHDWSRLLDSPTFADLASQASTRCPLPEPRTLVLDHEAPPVSCDPVLLARVLENAMIEFDGVDAIRKASAVCAHLPADRHFNCQMNRKGSVCRVSLEVSFRPVPVAPTWTSKSRESKEMGAAGAANDGARLPPVSQMEPAASWMRQTAPVRRWMLLVICVFMMMVGAVGGVGVMELRQMRLMPAPSTSQATTPRHPAPSEDTPAHPADDAVPRFRQSKRAADGQQPK